jgi:hypothetical protein
MHPYQGSWLRPSSGEAEFLPETKVVFGRLQVLIEVVETVTEAGE